MSNIAFKPGLYEKLPYDPIRDFVPVGLAYTLPMRWLPAAACRNPAWRKLSKLLARTPDRFSIGSPGRGSAPQVLGAAMMKSAGVRFVEIPYKGTQAQYADLLAGRYLMFSSESAALPHVATGKIKGDRHRLPAAQQPRARQSDHGRKRDARIKEMEAGLGCSCRPRRRRILWSVFVDELRQSIPALTERFAASGGEPMQLTRAETDAFVRRELERWMTVIREAGICAD